jgi:replication factor C small subunit
VFRFKRLPKEQVEEYLKLICKKEGSKFEDNAIGQIIEGASGDLRHSINVLQAAAVMGSVSTVNVTTSLGLSGKSKVGDIIKMAIAGKFNEARLKLMELTAVYGMSEFDFLKYANEAGYSMKLTHPEEFAALMAEYDHRLTTGAHPEIQLAALLAQLGRLGKGK